MATQFGDFTKLGQEQVEQMSATAASIARGFQAIAAETTDYSKRSLENTSAYVEKLLGVKSFDTAIQLQSEFAKSQFEGFLAQTNKIGEIYKDIAKEAFKPVETAMAKGQDAVHSS
ncbi:Phasin protein [Beijerinckiaceae bacterium RH AL1]|jgi:phasin family protein|nr:phasin family protein [Beijerinckiaceae bacterium]VVB44251.1 Phasin protein [Beijerinckiaceae bacterium RH CH11]VVB44309.1 Phasin protein [Beijerinckiaceae bacterium RH AL8]VVC54248.1 Phasin protein [Beijerinckiaceae bacterium RH AL1]